MNYLNDKELPKDSFWNFPSCSKYDVLEESRHLHLITGALSDPLTGVELVDNKDAVLYGPEEALLVRAKSFSLKIGLCLYGAFTSLIYRN